MSVDDRMPARRNALFTDLVDVMTTELRDCGVADNQALAVANLVADRLADYWGGQNFTFPKDFRWKLAQRELEIYDGFTGSNYGELAQRCNMTERGLRKLIARVRRWQDARQQPDLFEAPKTVEN